MGIPNFLVAEEEKILYIINRNKQEWEDLMDRAEDSAKVLQTKRILAAQLVQLLEHKSFKKISVNDICQRAMVSRSTFYLHFEDKYQLFRYCIEQEIKQMETALQEKNVGDFILFTLDSFLEKKNFYYNTLVADADQELIDIFQSSFCRFFTAYIEGKQQAGRTIPGPVSIVSAFYAGGITASTAQWIRNNFDISKEEMAQCQQDLLSGLLD